MRNEISIKELIKLSIGQIRELDRAQQTIANIVEAQRRSVKQAIEETEIEDEWAEKFLEDLK